MGMLDDQGLGCRVIVFGAGPAGLAVAYTVQELGGQATILERSGGPGGMSRSFEYGGGMVDIGPHVIGMEYPRVAKLFRETLGDSYEEFRLDTVMVWKGREFSYPPKAGEIVSKLGVRKAVSIAVSCVWNRVRWIGKPVRSYRDMARKKYGRVIADECIGPYVERLWGRPCEEISFAWKPGRFIGSTVFKWIVSAFSNRGDVMVSHPTHGMGLFYERLAERVQGDGVEIRYKRDVSRLEHDGDRILRVHVRSVVEGGDETVIEGDGVEFVSTLPLTVLLGLLDPPPPDEILEQAKGLGFRNTVLVYVVAESGSSPEHHILYLNDRVYRVCRVTNFGRWASGMKVVDPDQTVLACEIWSGFDGLWKAEDDEVIALMIGDLEMMGVRVLDACVPRVVRVVHSHPVITLESIGASCAVHEYINAFSNLTLAGRAGCFEYADQDKILDLSMQMAEELVRGST